MKVLSTLAALAGVQLARAAPVAHAPEQFAAFVKSESARFAEVIKKTNVSLH